MDGLDSLLAAADADLLRKLVGELTPRPDLQRAAVQFLKQHVPAPADQDAGASALSLWAELEPDLDELDTY